MSKRVIESPRDCGRREEHLAITDKFYGCWCEDGLYVLDCPSPDRFPDDCPLESLNRLLENARDAGRRLAPKTVTREWLHDAVLKHVPIGGDFGYTINGVAKLLRELGISVEKEKP
jgi:hypothetical protein